MVWCRVMECGSCVWCWVVAVWGVVTMSRPCSAIWIVCIVEVWVNMMLRTEAPVAVKSLMTIEGIVISVHVAVVVSISPMSIIEILIAESERLSVV